MHDLLPEVDKFSYEFNFMNKGLKNICAIQINMFGGIEFLQTNQKSKNRVNSSAKP